MNTLVECHGLVQRYSAWLRASTHGIELENEVCVLEVPFLDRHNDHIQIYVTGGPTSYRLTDDGFTIGDLVMAGVDINTDRRREYLNLALARLGVRLEGSELVVNATAESLPARQHSLVHAILAVSDMFYLAKEHVRSFFVEDVRAFLKEAGVHGMPDVKLQGRSGLDHEFHLGIPAQNGLPERLIRAINNPDRSQISDYMLAWSDTKGNRDADAVAVAVLNDEESSVPNDIVAALHNYGIQTASWADRKSVLASLGVGVTATA